MLQYVKDSNGSLTSMLAILAEALFTRLAPSMLQYAKDSSGNLGSTSVALAGFCATLLAVIHADNCQELRSVCSQGPLPAPQAPDQGSGSSRMGLDAFDPQGFLLSGSPAVAVALGYSKL